MVPVAAALLLWGSGSEYSLAFLHVSSFCRCVWKRVGAGMYGEEGEMGQASGKIFFFNIYIHDAFIFQDRRVEGDCLAESFIWSAINLPCPWLPSFTPPAIYPSFPVAKGPCLFVALVICTNFLCNLFPSQPPTWSSRVRVLKVEPLIPAIPFPPITPCLFPLPQVSDLLSFEVSLGF